MIKYTTALPTEQCKAGGIADELWCKALNFNRQTKQEGGERHDPSSKVKTGLRSGLLRLIFPVAGKSNRSFDAKGSGWELQV